MHFGQGILLGVLRSVMAHAGLRGPWSSAKFTVIRLTNDQILENACTASKPLQVGDLLFQREDQAARWYSLITPPSTRWRRIGPSMGTVADRWSSLGGCWSRDWCGR